MIVIKETLSNISRHIVALCCLMVSGAVFAEGNTHVIKAQATQFQPIVLFIEPGDTVSWINMIGHDAQSIEGLIPDGAGSFHIPLGINGSVTLEEEGTYIYKCTPHVSLGMVGAIIVGDGNKNIDTVKANAKGMAKRAVAKARSALKNKSQ